MRYNLRPMETRLRLARNESADAKLKKEAR